MPHAMYGQRVSVYSQFSQLRIGALPGSGRPFRRRRSVSRMSQIEIDHQWARNTT